MSAPIPLSVLDVVPVGTGHNPAECVRRVLDLARLADRLGFVRYWFAEHHGMPSVASASPEVLIGHVACATQQIRVGSGGVMLPNHAPLRITEAFRTLEALHPGRIDLGLGRAPGSDQKASRALRASNGLDFPELLREMLVLTGQAQLPGNHWLNDLHAMPAGVPLPPIWILGSSGASANLAGSLGMGYSFASHFSPTPPAPAFEAYRRSFQPSAQFPEPHTILGVSVICAETLERAEYLASSMDLAWVRLSRGEFGTTPSPEEAMRYPYTPAERRIADERRAMTILGTPESVRAQIEAKAAACGASEVMITGNIHSHEERLKSYELLAAAFAMQ
jgi:luciferase family oxidoreductase group 1